MQTELSIGHHHTHQFRICSQVKDSVKSPVFKMFGRIHGRLQTFFQEGQKFSMGGQEPTFCLKKQQKNTTFLKKSLKTYYF